MRNNYQHNNAFDWISTHIAGLVAIVVEIVQPVEYPLIMLLFLLPYPLFFELFTHKTAIRYGEQPLARRS